MKTKKERIIDILKENPDLSSKHISEDIGCSKRYVRQIRNEEGYPYTSEYERLTKAQKKELIRLQRLEENIKEIQSRRKIISHLYGKKIRIGIISDTHEGSLHANPRIVESLYKIFKKEKVEAVYHAGDWVEGEHIYRGQEYERYINGGDNMANHIIETYPDIGLKTYGISGNHDQSYWKTAGIDIVKHIADKRDDIVYLGRDEADIKLAENIILRLVHPDGGTAYAMSYKLQKYIESLSGGQKPTIIVMGHYHKAELLPQYRNIVGIQAGTTQSQTPYLKRKASPAHLGGWILDIQVDKKQLMSKFKAEFISFYEPMR